MKLQLLFFIFIFISTGYSKTMSVDDYLNITLVDSSKDIPATPGKPNITMQGSGNFRGWVDIVGWKEMIRENGADYIPGVPKDYVIVAGDVSFDSLRSRIVTDPRITNCYWCLFDSLDKKVEITQEGNETIATLYATLRWHETVESSGTSQKFSYVDSAQFKTRVKSPRQYYRLNPTLISAHIIRYNNSFNPKSVISVDAPNASKISVGYHGDTLIHSIKLIAVNYTDNGVAFGDVSQGPGVWDTNNRSGLIAHFGDNFVINSGNVDYNDVVITVSTPYEKLVVSNKTVEEIGMSPNTVFNPILWPFLAFLFVSTLIIRKIIKVV